MICEINLYYSEIPSKIPMGGVPYAVLFLNFFIYIYYIILYIFPWDFMHKSYGASY